MGVSLYNKDYDMDMGYGTFFNLRKVVASLYNKDFGEFYHNWMVDKTVSDEDMDNKVQSLYDEGIFNNVDDEALDFLFLPDVKGKISYKSCRRILEIIGDYTDDYMYGYLHANHSFDYFKEMLRDCVKRRRTLYWD